MSDYLMRTAALTALSYRVCLIAILSLTPPGGAQTLEWARQFATPTPDATFQIALDLTGIYMGGITQGALPGQTAVSPLQDGFLRKYDADGNILWTREFSTGASGFGVNGVATDDGGVYVVGSPRTGTGPARRRAANGGVSVVTKYDKNGNQLWTHSEPPSGTIGGENGAAVAASGGAVYVAGTFTGVVNNLPAQGIYLRKFDPAGNILWTKQFSGPGGLAYGLTAGPNGIYVTGTTGTTSLTTPPSPTDQNLFVRKYDPDGNALWTRQFGAASSVYAIAANATGVFVAGSTQGLLGIQTLPTFDLDAYVRKYDHDGNLLWTQQFGTIDREEAFGVAADSDGVYAVGYARSGLNMKTLGGADAFVRRFDNLGNPIWTIQTGSVDDDYGYSVATDGTKLYIGGYTDKNTIPEDLTRSADSFLYKYLPPPPGGPAILEGGIVNNASFAVAPSPVAPGSIAAIFGSGLNDGSVVVSSAFDSDGKLVTTLGGASVTVGGFPAPLFYSLSGQLGIQIPMELVGQTSAQVQVTVGGQASVTRTVNIRPESPGIFTQTQNGQGTALCVHQDGITVITPDNRAHPGETIICYGTGFGAVSPALATGQPSAGSQTVSIPKVTIDGLPGDVVYSGLTAGLVGFNQINMVVPGLARTDAADALVVSMNNVQANNVTLPVGP
jgi:uncharacterized protein (TIGR03437 family)